MERWGKKEKKKEKGKKGIKKRETISA